MFIRGCLFAIPAVFAVMFLYGQEAPAAWYAAETNLLTRRTLNIPVAGCVTGAFSRALSVMRASNVLERVQQAYAAQLPTGERPEFEVKLAGPGHYYYVNKYGERCDIHELRREGDSNSWMRLAFHVEGERNFGKFDSLIYLTVRRGEPNPDEVFRYEADVRVWPHGAVVRVVLRYLPGVELYFRKKTAEMRALITGIIGELIA